jgi:hypothetical protein
MPFRSAIVEPALLDNLKLIGSSLAGRERGNDLLDPFCTMSII